MSRAPSLYLITDRHLSTRPLPEIVTAALAGVDPTRVAVQLREKDLGGRALFELGRAVLEVCRSRRVPLLINDRIDVARALGASGVHLGGGSLPALEARRILGPGALIGISSHGPDELRQRAEGADFSTWGPLHFTASKAKYGPPVGLRGFEEVRTLGVPLVALGGVTVETARPLRGQGFAGAACIGAVFSAHDPGAAAQALLAAYDGALD